MTLPIGWLSAFSLTLCVETAVGAALGFRRPRELTAIAAANLVSHPGFYALAFRCAVSWGTQAYLARLPLDELKIDQLFVRNLPDSTTDAAVVQSIITLGNSLGLSVIAELDEGSYPIGIKISDRQMKDLPISRDDWHGDWNYTLHPTRDTPETH